jgi:hypothetical protein
MSSVVINGDTSGAITVTVPAVAGTNTATFPAATGTVMVSGNMPAFSAYQGTTQSVSSSTPTNMTISTKEFDTATAFNNTGSTTTLNGLSVPAYAFMPPVAGYYQINGQVTFTSTASTRYAYCILYKKGTAFKQGAFSPLSSADYVAINVSSIIYLDGTTDYVQLYGGQNSVSTVTTIASGVSYTYFNGSLVRAA